MPVLFNLCFICYNGYLLKSSLFSGWVTVKYEMGRRLVGNRNAKAKLEEVRITESKFVDDVACMQQKEKQWRGICVKIHRLTVSLEKLNC